MAAINIRLSLFVFIEVSGGYIELVSFFPLKLIIHELCVLVGQGTGELGEFATSMPCTHFDCEVSFPPSGRPIGPLPGAGYHDCDRLNC